MEIFNIGIPELIFILIIMLILLGPEEMVKTARRLAREARKIIRSPLWSDLVKAQHDIQDLPSRLVREAGIEDLNQEVRQINQEVQATINSVYQPISIQPPEIQTPEQTPPLSEGQLDPQAGESYSIRPPLPENEVNPSVHEEIPSDGKPRP